MAAVSLTTKISIEMDILLTWVGSRDPTWDNPRTANVEDGPILSLLAARSFDRVYLLFNHLATSDDFATRATGVLRACQKRFPGCDVRQKPVDLVSVTDYQEVFRTTNHACQEILSNEGSEGTEYFVYLSPGTPQMQAVWILLTQSGLMPGRMILATPPDLVAPGLPTWREVDLSLADFPRISSPGDEERLIGVLTSQNQSLLRENELLRAEVEVLRSQGEDQRSAVPAGFSLGNHLSSLEKLWMSRAIDQSDGNAAAAARLLGVEPAAFRARAAALGLRGRKKRASQK